MKKVKIQFTLNGKAVSVEVHPMARLLDVLRNECGLTGTKEGCGEGECGACSVILNDELAMSCTVPAVQAEGGKVETIEGLEEAFGDKLHPLQEAFIRHGGAQCGICTPGMIMAALAYLRHPERVPGGVKEALEGNICRCTGYRGIFEAVKKAAEEVLER